MVVYRLLLTISNEKQGLCENLHEFDAHCKIANCIKLPSLILFGSFQFSLKGEMHTHTGDLDRQSRPQPRDLSRLPCCDRRGKLPVPVRVE